MKCNGCGGEIDQLGGTFSYGDVSNPVPPHESQHLPDVQDVVYANHHRTFCPKCAKVLKDIILNSDLSDHWEE